MSHYLECISRGEFCPLCYSGRKGRAAYRGHYGYRPPRPLTFERWEAMKKRKSDSGVTLSDSPLSLSCRVGKMFPEVTKFILAPKYDDGSSRQPGTVMLLAEDGICKAWLHDRDAGISCFVSGNTLEATLVAAEAAIDGTAGDWRPYKPKGGKR